MIVSKPLALVALCAAVTACATNSPGWSYQPPYDPVCQQVKQDIIATESIGKHAYSMTTASNWRCIRNESKYARVTLVVQPERNTYRLDLYFDKDGHVQRTEVKSDTYAQMIGPMAMHARIDSLSTDLEKMKDGDLYHLYFFVR